MIDKKYDFLIDVENPEALDKTLNMLGAALIQKEGTEYKTLNGHYIVRCPSGNKDYIKFCCKNQGYGKILEGENDDL